MNAGSRNEHCNRQPKAMVTLLLPSPCFSGRFTVLINLVYRASSIYTGSRETVSSSKKARGRGEDPGLKSLTLYQAFLCFMETDDIYS